MYHVHGGLDFMQGFVAVIATRRASTENLESVRQRIVHFFQSKLRQGWTERTRVICSPAEAIFNGRQSRITLKRAELALLNHWLEKPAREKAYANVCDSESDDSAQTIACKDTPDGDLVLR